MEDRKIFQLSDDPTWTQRQTFLQRRTTANKIEYLLYLFNKKCGKNEKVRDFLFFPRYGVFCDLLQYIRTLKRNLFALYIK